MVDVTGEREGGREGGREDISLCVCVRRARQCERKRDGGKEGGREIESEEGGREGDGEKAYVCLPPVKIDRERQFKGKKGIKRLQTLSDWLGRASRGGKERGRRRTGARKEKEGKKDKPANKVKVPKEGKRERPRALWPVRPHLRILRM